MGLTLAPMMLYNTSIKIAENIITLKTYEDTQVYGYQTKGTIKTRGDKLKEIIAEWEIILQENFTSSRYVDVKLMQMILNYNSYFAKKQRFESSCRRAKSKIFDLIVCNVNKHLDHDGKRQRTKFLTLTFKKNMQDIEQANLEVTKFLKRLSDRAYNINKNVIKYICVPELQERGAWHYHIVLFNMKFIPFDDYEDKETGKKKKGLLNTWGNGGVWIQALPVNGATKIAKYITKYISKGIEITEFEGGKTKEGKIKKDMCVINDDTITEDKLGDKRLSNYDNYLKHNMVNKKRYQCSRGLYKPVERKLKITRAEWSMLTRYLVDNAKRDKLGNKIVYYHELNNPHRGQINVLVSEICHEDLKALKTIVGLAYNENRKEQSKEYKVRFDVIKEIQKKNRENEEKNIREQDDDLHRTLKKLRKIKKSIINYPGHKEDISSELRKQKQLQTLKKIKEIIK